MGDASHHDLRQNTRKGFFSLTVRSAYLHLLRALSVILLARWLSPADYGVYAIINGYISVSWFFCDLGLNGSLVRQESDVSKVQLESCLGVQLFLSSGFAVLFWFLAPFLTDYHQLGAHGIWLIRALSLTIPFYGVRGTPRILLERELNFSRIGRIEVIESCFSYFAQIVFAALGFSVWSFVAANAVRACVGSILYLRTLKQRLMPCIRFLEIKPLLAYGIPFQLNAILPAMKGLVVPVVMGSLLSVDKLGFITWSLGLASIPFILATNYNQVMFASLSRTQSSPEEFKALVSRAFEIALLGLIFCYGLGSACSTSLILTLFGTKWASAIPIMPLAILGSGLYTFRYLMASIFNSKGQPHTRLRIELLALALEVVGTLALTPLWGTLGYLYAFAGSQGLLFVTTWFVIKSELRIKTSRRIFVLFFAVGVALVTLSAFIPETDLWIRAGAFTILFFSISFLFRISILKDLKWMFRTIYRSVNPSQLLFSSK